MEALMDSVAIPIRGRDGAIGAWTLLDCDVAPIAARYSWHLNGGYACGAAYLGEGEEKPVLLHRWILGDACAGKHTDHINRKKLDNRRANLRPATGSENQQNRASWSGRKFRGVYRERGRWVAKAWLQRAQITVGRFDTPEEADVAIRAWRAEHMPFSPEARALKG